MKKLYHKNELYFTLFWIVIYCFLQSIAHAADDWIGIPYCFSTLFSIMQTATLFCFLRKNDLLNKYGLCLPRISSKSILSYIPLLILASNNLWNGFAFQYSFMELCFYICFMLCVGFLEELIFRGFLFKAIEKNNLTRAMIISSVTFGVGHILNSINGSGMDLATNILQIVTAIAFGFLFVTLFHQRGNLWPCIIAHSCINISAAFSNKTGLTTEKQILFLIIELTMIAVYIFALTKLWTKKQSMKI